MATLGIIIGAAVGAILIIVFVYKLFVKKGWCKGKSNIRGQEYQNNNRSPNNRQGQSARNNPPSARNNPPSARNNVPSARNQNIATSYQNQNLAYNQGPTIVHVPND
jgi:hypothetical protein